MGALDDLTAAERQQFREAHAQRKLTAGDFASHGARGTCPVPDCGGDYQLTKRGVLRKHLRGQSWQDCPGSGKPPVRR